MDLTYFFFYLSIIIRALVGKQALKIEYLRITISLFCDRGWSVNSNTTSFRRDTSAKRDTELDYIQAAKKFQKSMKSKWRNLRDTQESFNVVVPTWCIHILWRWRFWKSRIDSDIIFWSLVTDCYKVRTKYIRVVKNIEKQ